MSNKKFVILTCAHVFNADHCKKEDDDYVEVDAYFFLQRNGQNKCFVKFKVLEHRVPHEYNFSKDAYVSGLDVAIAYVELVEGEQEEKLADFKFQDYKRFFGYEVDQ